MTTTAREFAADLQRLGCRIEWDETIGWPGSNFFADIGRGRNRKRVLITFYGEGGGFWYAQVGNPGRYLGGERLRSMKAVREYLGVAA